MAITKAINVNDKAAATQAVAKSGGQQNIKSMIQQMSPQFAKALPAVMTPERFARIATTAITKNPQLAECTPASFFGALLSAAQLGLEPNTQLGQAYLIPYRNYKTNSLECQFQVGYRGLIELAHRSGELKSIEAHCVHENDEFVYELGLDPKLVHKPAMSNRGKVTWVYAVYHLKNGGYGFEVMSTEDINKHRAQFSKAKSSPWDTNWEAMAKKTVVKQALKYAPMSSEFVRASAEDNATLKVNDFAADEIEITPEYVEVDENGVVIDVDAEVHTDDE